MKLLWANLKQRYREWKTRSYVEALSVAEAKKLLEALPE